MASSDEELMTSQSNVNETLSTTEQSKEGNSSHVAVPDSAHVSESEALRRSRRDTKLTLKAREQKVLLLSQRLVNIVDEFQEQSETFSVAAESKELHDVQVFVSQMEHKSHAICSTFDEIKTLSENKVESVTQNLFEQFIAESQQLRDYLQQREERHEEDE